MKRVVPALRAFISTSTGWAIIICAVGAAASFLPWIRVSSSGLIFLSHPLSNAFDLARFGDPCWHAIGATSIFGILGFVFIATFSTNPITLWSTVAVFASGVGVIVELCLLFSWAYQPRPTTQDLKVEGRIVSQESVNVYYDPLVGAIASLGCGIGLLLLSALQIRVHLFRVGTPGKPDDSRPDGSPEPSVANVTLNVKPRLPEDGTV